MARHPQAVRELLAQEMLKGSEVMILITGPQALDRLTMDCKFPEEKARRVLNIAWEFGQKAEPCPGGYVHIWYHGRDDTDNHVFSVVEHIGPGMERKVAQDPGKGYTQGRTMPRRSGKAIKETTKGTAMPPRRTRNAAPEPEVAEQNGGEVDLKKHLTKPLSPKMTDYVTWFEANVGSLDDIEVDRILVLGTTMYKYFQTSDFNAEQTEARRAEREAEEPAPEPEVAAPARSGRTRSTAKAPAAKPARAAREPRRLRPVAHRPRLDPCHRCDGW